MRHAVRLARIGRTREKYEGTTRKSGKRAVWTGVLNFDEKAMRVPYSWKRPRLIFVNSMSDLFHEHMPEDIIRKVFAVMEDTPWHTYQVLTKRAEHLVELSLKLPWPRNVWMGVSVESEEYLWRIDLLRRCPAAVRFLSLEPLLGPLNDLDLSGIGWVIAGGESGPRARPIDPIWVRDIRDQCVAVGVPFHFKRWGGTVKKKTGRELDGRTWDDFPQSHQTRSDKPVSARPEASGEQDQGSDRSGAAPMRKAAPANASPSVTAR
jgi:protein gp37